ncbi:hypothetical protein AB0F73_20145 [Micromonospora purpureochromogenes]|uniref:hypothetical protein n=1 Tax=Micromonospora purpureochromogenes TaxID=47872 RepID=UPI00340241C8
MTTIRRGGPAGPASSGEQASPAPRRPTTRCGTAWSTPSSDAPLPADPRLARELLDGLAEAVVTTDHAGIVTLVNATAGELLPELTPGTDLARCAVPALASAVRRGGETFDTEHRGRRLRGVCRRLAAGRCAWYVRDATHPELPHGRR